MKNKGKLVNLGILFVIYGVMNNEIQMMSNFIMKFKN